LPVGQITLCVDPSAIRQPRGNCVEDAHRHRCRWQRRSWTALL